MNSGGALRGVFPRRRSRLSFPTALVARCLFPVCLLLACLLPARSSQGAEPDADARGRKLFEQAAAWVAAGRTTRAALRDVYADLQDVKIHDGGTHHEGYMRIWLQQPGRLRWELRIRALLARGDRMQ